MLFLFLVFSLIALVPVFGFCLTDTFFSLSNIFFCISPLSRSSYILATTVLLTLFPFFFSPLRRIMLVGLGMPGPSLGKS